MILNQSFKLYKGKRVLITGHTGFIGSWLAKVLLMLDAEICGYALNPPSQPNMFEILKLETEIQDTRGNIRNKDTLRKTIEKFHPQIVFHLAAQPIVLKSYDDPCKTFDINVTGTVNLLNELRKVDSVKTIIVMTSDKTYRNKEWPYPYRENDELGGKDPYSASKSCQDIVVNSFRESFFLDQGVGISSVRSGNVIGGGDWASHRIIPDLVRGIVKGKTVKIRNPNSIRPWQHVLEPLSGMLFLAERMYKDYRISDSWNFGPDSQSSRTVKELTEEFIHYYEEGDFEIEKTTDFKESKYLQIDISKAKNKLNWHPRFNYEETVKKTVEWYKSYYNGTQMEQFTKNQIYDYWMGERL